ncbi:MAG: DUF3152 domain-containing protein [Terracoccus sp.]
MRPTSRARVWATGALVACVAADLAGVAVASAANRDPGSESAVARASELGFAVGTGTPTTGTRSRGSSSALSSTSAEAPAAPAAPAASDAGETVPAAPKTSAPAGTGSAAVVEHGNGHFTVLALPAGAARPAPSSGRVVRYTVEIEGGLATAGPDYARTVASVLTDPRGWQTVDTVKFVNVTPAQAKAGTKPDLRILLASPDTVDSLCAPLKTRGQVSCHNLHHVVLNQRRWELGADAYGSDIASYRTYLVNHEVGHGIGHGHQKCPGKGRPAPVMMQQTYGLDGCTPWTWPSAKRA